MFLILNDLGKIVKYFEFNSEAENWIASVANAKAEGRGKDYWCEVYDSYAIITEEDFIKERDKNGCN